MENELLKKISELESLTKNEANAFLEIICQNIRSKYGIVNPFDTNCKLCNETSTLFGGLLYVKYGFDVERYNIKELLNIPITHFFNTITLNVEGSLNIYLVDMTYSQFFADKVGLDTQKKVSTKNSFKKIENEQFVNDLRKNGYILLTDEVLKSYLGAFLDTCKVKDKDSVYKSICDTIYKNQAENNIKRS